MAGDKMGPEEEIDWTPKLLTPKRDFHQLLAGKQLSRHCLARKPQYNVVFQANRPESFESACKDSSASARPSEVDQTSKCSLP
jgi:hypothetical protein